MKSRITAKYQVTIPKDVRERLKLHVSDCIEWKLDGDAVVVEPVRKPFLEHEGAVAIGPGDVAQDIAAARRRMASRRR